MSEPVPPQLEYGVRPRFTRRRVLRAVGWLLVIAIGIGVWHSGGEVWRRVQLLYWQRQCMIYDGQPPAVPPVSSSGRNYRGGMIVDPPNCLLQFQRFFPQLAGWCRVPRIAVYNAIPAPDQVFMIHGRRSRGGNRRMVIVSQRFEFHSILVSFLQASIIEPGTLFHEPEVIGLGGNTMIDLQATSVTVTIDRTDESHFTVSYQKGAETVTVDGWLRDDDTVVFKQRP